MKDQLLLAMKDAGQINVASRNHLGNEIVERGDPETGYDLQILLIAVIQLGKPGPHTKCIQYCIFPGILPADGTNLFSDRIQVQCHIV